jgi:outer membrane lipoprotein-sorting protein
MQRRAFLSAVALVSAAGPWLFSGDALAKGAPLDAAQLARIDAANRYLTGLKAARARFNQSDPQGNLSSGVFWLRRPGRARFQYDAPADLLVVADGYNVMVYDRKLKTFDQYPLGSTPLGLLLARDVRLDKGVAVSSVVDTPRGFSITAHDGHRPRDGSITLEFADSPMALIGWMVVDGQGQRTQVALGPLSTDVAVDPQLFVLRDPKPRSGRP